MAYRVIAVDDHDIALIGLSTILGPAEDIDLVGQFKTVADVIDSVDGNPDSTVDLVMLDLRLADGSDPYDNVRALLERDLNVLIFSALESPYLVRQALKGGALGVIQKSACSEEILEAVRIAVAGDTVANTDLASLIDSDPLTESIDLSARQLEVLELYAQGEPAKRVASLTGLSVDTVQDYITRIRNKYALAGRPAHNKVEMFVRGQEDGYIPGPMDTVRG